MNISATSLGLCFAFSLFGLQALHADVKIRPGDKPKETTKDFIKDIKKNGYPTPEPHDRSVSFTEGMSVDVELEVATSSLGAVKFTIRDAPKYGKLSAIRSHPSGESNKALVTYTHTGTREELMDRFTFQAKLSEGTNTSAPGVITLIGKQAMPRLDVLEVGQFKRLQPGEQDAQRVVVQNSGTAAFSDTLKWPEPFIGPPKLDLAVNEKQTFMLMIKPDKPGAYRIDRELQPGVVTSRVQAYVECVQPFGVSPSALTLEFDSKAGNRSGTVMVSNGSPSPLKLRLEATGRLGFARELELAPKESKGVEVSLKADDVALFHGELWVIQDPVREKVVVHADPEPPQLSMTSPAEAKIDFGKIPKGKQASSTVTLANAGGVPALLKVLALPSPFALEESDLPNVPPGKSVTLTVVFNPTQTGDYKGALSLGGNGGQIDIALSGSMFDPSRPTATNVPNINLPQRPSKQDSTGPRRQAAAAPPTAESPAVEAPIEPSSLRFAPPSPPPAPVEKPPVKEEDLINGKPSLLSMVSNTDDTGRQLRAGLMTWGIGPETLPSYKSSTLDAVPMIGLSEVGRNYVVLGWEKPKVEPKEYLLQRSVYKRAENGFPMKSWEVIKDWKPVPAPAGIVGARVEGLNAGSEYEFRVLGVDEKGKFSPTSDLLRLVTSPPWRTPPWMWLLGSGLLVGVTVLVIRRMQEQRMLAV